MPHERLLDLDWLPEWSADGTVPHVMRVRGSYPRHRHLFHELVLVAAGRGRHADAGGERELRAGDLLLVHPHAWHAYPDGEDLRIVNCLFLPAIVPAHPGLFAALGPARRLVERRHARPAAAPPLHLRATAAVRRELDARFHTMQAEAAARRPGWRAAVLGAFAQVLVAVHRLESGEAAVPGPAASDRAVDAVAARLAADYHQPLPPVAVLAAQVGLSRDYLSRRFSQRTGLGIVAFVHQLRIEDACRRLVLGDEPVTAVALAVGYDDPAYFARIFRRLVGCSPRRYRQRER